MLHKNNMSDILQNVVTPYYRIVMRKDLDAFPDLMAGFKILDDEMKLRGQKFFGGKTCDS